MITVQTSEIAPLIVRTLENYLEHSYRNEVMLILGTMAAESSLKERVQRDGGPARGLCQVEPATARDVFEHYLRYDPDRYRPFFRVWLHLESVPFFIPSQKDCAYHLEFNDVFSILITRAGYLRRPGAIPDTVEGQAAYWKRWHNTYKGKQTVEHYISQWEACHCESLLEYARVV